MLCHLNAFTVCYRLAEKHNRAISVGEKAYLCMLEDFLGPERKNCSTTPFAHLYTSYFDSQQVTMTKNE